MKKAPNRVVARYSKALTTYGSNSAKALRWHSYASAAKRYVELVKDLDIKDHTILDVGCGFGDIIPYLLSKHSNFTYTGMDIMPEFIEVAQQRYEGFNFVTGDFWDKSFVKKFDYIICCGTLNGKEWTLSNREKMIKKLFNQAEVGIAFCMIGHFPKLKAKKKNGKIGHIDALKMLKYCLKMTPKVIFRQHYHPDDFTIVLLK